MFHLLRSAWFAGSVGSNAVGTFEEFSCICNYLLFVVVVVVNDFVIVRMIDDSLY